MSDEDSPDIGREYDSGVDCLVTDVLINDFGFDRGTLKHYTKLDDGGRLDSLDLLELPMVFEERNVGPFNNGFCDALTCDISSLRTVGSLSRYMRLYAKTHREYVH